MYNAIVNKSNIQDIYKLSPMQSGILFHNLRDSESSAYLGQMIFTLEGDMDAEIMAKSYQALIEKYDVLRTIFLYEKVNQPLQVVLKKRNESMEYKDISELSCIEQREFLATFLERDQRRGFDLSQGSLVRLTLIKLKDQKYQLVFTNHHIILDGWSVSILIDNLFCNYKSLANKKAINVIQKHGYDEYIKWVETQDQLSGQDFWKNYLNGYNNVASIPQYGNQSESKNGYCTELIKLNASIKEKLITLAKTSNVTLNTIFQVIWGILLQRYNNTDDVVFGGVVSGRPAELKNVESIVGLFINTVPIRIKSKDGESFKELIKRVQKESLESEPYHYVSLPDIQVSSMLPTNFINHIFVFENFPISNRNFDPNSKFNISEITGYEHTHYDLNIEIVNLNEIEISITYNSQKYQQEQILQILKHLYQIVVNVTEENDYSDILTRKERGQLLVEFNNTEAEYPDNQTIHEIFEAQVVKTPNAIAVEYEEKKVTYAELNRRANQLARVLRKRGVEKDSFVGLMVERSVEMIVGILGILKSGGAYVPIDPEYPQERIEYILQDSKIQVLVTQQHLIGLTPSLEGTSIWIDGDQQCQEDDTNVDPVNGSHDLAYLIYTSGSTGNPKGVMVEHHAVINRLYWMVNKYDLNKEEVFLQKTPFVFDVSVWELLTWFMVGAKVCILKPKGEKYPEVIVEAIQKYNVTIIHFVPSMLQIFLDYIEIKDIDSITSLKKVFTSGEALLSKHVTRFKSLLGKRNLVLLHNLYGPTETTIEVTSFDVKDWNGKTGVPIGKPISNVQAYVLDIKGNLQPIGIPGELYIGGVCVTRGYLNRPDLTKEKFILNPFYPEGRIYRTGDMARWLPDGTLEYLGRLDDQVKIRGNRVELGEIESTLLQHRKIREVVVTTRLDQEEQPYLCAYVVAETDWTVRELRNHLKTFLPEYMIPSHFVGMEILPLTSNGKVDKRALPIPAGNLLTGQEYVAPRNSIEEKLVDIWQDVLGTNQIGIQDNFFERGGHSLKATMLVSKIYRKFNIEIPLREIFLRPTVEEVGNYLDEKENLTYNSKYQTYIVEIKGKFNIEKLEIFISDIPTNGNVSCDKHIEFKKKAKKKITQEDLYKLLKAEINSGITRNGKAMYATFIENDEDHYNLILSLEKGVYQKTNIHKKMEEFNENTCELLDINVLEGSSWLWKYLSDKEKLLTVPYSIPKYVKNEVQEVNMEIGENSIIIPATFTQPSGEGPYPVVIMVPGDGELDEDSTMFSLKPFKDIALGMATKNIASIRYRKRTSSSYGFFREYTIKDEFVADALAAYRQVITLPNVDKEKIFLLGHCRGGWMIPEILEALGEEKIAGTILLSAPNPLISENEAFVREEKRYMLERHEILEYKRQLKLIEDMGNIDDLKRVFSLKPSLLWWSSIKDVVPAQIAIKQQVPALIMQGGMDMNIPKEDLEFWKKALSNNPNVTCEYFPNLNHAYVESNQIGTFDDYINPQNVPYYVIKVIANWVRVNCEYRNLVK